MIIGSIVKHFYFFKSFFFVDFLQSHLYSRYNSNVSPNFHKIQYVSFIFTKLSSKSAMTNDQFNTSIKKRYFEANYTQTMPFLFFCSINHYKYTRVVELCWKCFYGKKKGKYNWQVVSDRFFSQQLLSKKLSENWLK